MLNGHDITTELKIISPYNSQMKIIKKKKKKLKIDNVEIDPFLKRYEV